MHRDHDVFISALNGFNRVRVTFTSKEDKTVLTRCALRWTMAQAHVHGTRRLATPSGITTATRAAIR